MEIHPEARKALSERAEMLLTQANWLPADVYVQETSEPKLVPMDIVAINVPNTAIIGHRMVRRFDVSGALEAIELETDGGRFGFSGEGGKKFIELVNAIQNTKAFSGKYLRETVEKYIIEWAFARHQNIEKREIIEYLTEEKSPGIHHIEILFPINNLIIQTPFRISNAEFIPLSKALIESWISQAIAKKPDDSENIKKWYNFHYGKLQGYGALRLSTIGIDEIATEDLQSTAQSIIDLLRVFIQPPIFISHASQICLAGSEWAPVYKRIRFVDEAGPSFSTGLLNQPLRTPIINSITIKLIQQSGFGIAISWLLSESRNDIQERILSSLSLYSRAALSLRLEDKLVYILASLEGLLLRNSSEPIQQNLGERMAFFLADEARERQAIVMNIRNVYELRSKYVHHGKKPTQEEAIEGFLTTTFNFYLLIIGRSILYKTKEEFINLIDEIKFGTKSFSDLFPEPPLGQPMA